MAATSDARATCSEPASLNVGLAADPKSSGIKLADIRNFRVKGGRSSGGGEDRLP